MLYKQSQHILKQIDKDKHSKSIYDDYINHMLDEDMQPVQPRSTERVKITANMTQQLFNIRPLTTNTKYSQSAMKKVKRRKIEVGIDQPSSEHQPNEFAVTMKTLIKNNGNFGIV